MWVVVAGVLVVSGDNYWRIQCCCCCSCCCSCCCYCCCHLCSVLCPVTVVSPQFTAPVTCISSRIIKTPSRKAWILAGLMGWHGEVTKYIKNCHCHCRSFIHRVWHLMYGDSWLLQLQRTKAVGSLCFCLRSMRRDKKWLIDYSNLSMCWRVAVADWKSTWCQTSNLLFRTIVQDRAGSFQEQRICGPALRAHIRSKFVRCVPQQHHLEAPRSPHHRSS